jgi:hypothetical protein
MPCHRTHKTAGLPGSFAFVAPRAEGHTGAPHGIPRLASGAATEPGPDRSPLGDQVHHSSLQSSSGVDHLAEQLPELDLSNETYSGHRSQSRWEQRLAGAGILAALLIAVTGGRPVAWLVLRIVEALS